MKLFGLSAILRTYKRIALLILAGVGLLIVVRLLTACTAPAPTVTPPVPTTTSAPAVQRVPYSLPVTVASFVTDGCWQRTSKIVVEGVSVWWIPDYDTYRECVKRSL